MEEFKIRKYIRSKDDEGVNDYIEALEGYILELKNKHTNRLLMKLEELNGVIADDIDKIITGEHVEERTKVSVETDKETGDVVEHETTYYVSTLKVLVDEKDSKVMDRVMSLYGRISQIQAVSQAIQGLVPEVEEDKGKKVEDSKELRLDGNIFEALQQKAIVNKK